MKTLYHRVLTASREHGVVDEARILNEKTDVGNMEDEGVPWYYARFAMIPLIPAERSFPNEDQKRLDHRRLMDLMEVLKREGLSPTERSEKFVRECGWENVQASTLTYDEEIPRMNAYVVHAPSNGKRGEGRAINQRPLREVVAVGYHIPETRFLFTK